MNLQYSFSTPSLPNQTQQQQQRTQPDNSNSTRSHKLISKLKIFSTPLSNSSSSSTCNNKFDSYDITTSPSSPTSLSSMKFSTPYQSSSQPQPQSHLQSKSSNSSPINTSVATFSSISYGNTTANSSSTVNNNPYFPITPPLTVQSSSSALRIRSNSLPNFTTTKAKYKHQNLLSKYTNKHKNNTNNNNNNVNSHSKLQALNHFHQHRHHLGSQQHPPNGSKFPSFSNGDTYKHYYHSDEDEHDRGEDYLFDNYNNYNNSNDNDHINNDLHDTNDHNDDDEDEDDNQLIYDYQHSHEFYDFLNSPPTSVDYFNSAMINNYNNNNNNNNNNLNNNPHQIMNNKSQHQLSSSTRASSISNYQDDELIMIPPLPIVTSSSNRPSLSSSEPITPLDRHNHDYVYSTTEMVTPTSTNNEANLSTISSANATNNSTTSTTTNAPLLKSNYSLVQKSIEEDNVDKLANSILKVVKINNNEDKQIEWGI